jgi:hypothetical protein
MPQQVTRMRLQPCDFFDTAITPELIRTAVEPAIEALDLYIASKYARLFINGPVIMAAVQDARYFLRTNYPNLQFQLQADMTQLKEGEMRFVIDIEGVHF